MGSLPQAPVGAANGAYPQTSCLGGQSVRGGGVGRVPVGVGTVTPVCSQWVYSKIPGARKASGG